MGTLGKQNYGAKAPKTAAMAAPTSTPVMDDLKNLSQEQIQAVLGARGNGHDAKQIYDYMTSKRDYGGEGIHKAVESYLTQTQGASGSADEGRKVMSFSDSQRKDEDEGPGYAQAA